MEHEGWARASHAAAVRAQLHNQPGLNSNLQANHRQRTLTSLRLKASPTRSAILEYRRANCDTYRSFHLKKILRNQYARWLEMSQRSMDDTPYLFECGDVEDEQQP
ncbi:hypothetical protein NDU88_006366 [Pleurodeles waltl]|uniref:Uncharacterized protein n=1 Tax=Pleurodeles waltl TaxID=8319 RepID=A0AAV7LNX2_PLEWA|nr:hypothetical protein NDU88_006366 [Pleurodeles waltl]